MDSYEKREVVFVLLIGFFVWGLLFLINFCFVPSNEAIAKDHAMQVIQEVDGCKVYRFYDGDYHYMTRCGEEVTTQKNWNENCGKACTRHKTEDITTEGNQ